MGRVDDGNDAAALAGDNIHDDVTLDQQAFLGKAGVKEFEDLSPDEARKRLKYVNKSNQCKLCTSVVCKPHSFMNTHRLCDMV